MSTERARRLEEFLREDLDWETGIGSHKKCSSCGANFFRPVTYCSDCGELVYNVDIQDEVILTDLENAMSYALGETE